MSEITAPPISDTGLYLPPTWPPDRLEKMPHTLNDHLDNLARTMPPPEADIIWVRKWVSTAADFRYATPRHLVSWTGFDLHRVEVDYMVGYLVECGLGQFHATEIALDIGNARKLRRQWQQSLATPESVPNAKKRAVKECADRATDDNNERITTTCSSVGRFSMWCFIRFADFCMVVSLLWGISSILFPTKLEDVWSDFCNMVQLHGYRQ